MEIKFKKLSANAKTPSKKHSVDAGFDFYASWKKETEKYVEYGTDNALEIPDGYVGLMFPRSSVRDQDLILKNCVGVIDASYRGEIKFSFLHAIHDAFKNVVDYKNNDCVDVGTVPRHMNKYDVGDRIGQVVFMKIPDIQLVEAKELNETNRGTAGYGSSGIK